MVDGSGLAYHFDQYDSLAFAYQHSMTISGLFNGAKFRLSGGIIENDLLGQGSEKAVSD